jgi:hypothetical protein
MRLDNPCEWNQPPGNSSCIATAPVTEAKLQRLRKFYPPSLEWDPPAFLMLFVPYSQSHSLPMSPPILGFILITASFNEYVIATS